MTDSESHAEGSAPAARPAKGALTLGEGRQAERAVGALLVRSVTGQVIAIARQFAVLPLITPGQLGLLRYVLNLSTYSRFFHIGFLSTLWVRYPERQAAGDVDYCAAVQVSAWRQVLVGLLLYTPVMAALLRGTSLAPWLFYTVVALSALPLLGDYIAISYQVRGEFEALVRIDLVTSVVGFVLLVGMTVLWGLPGLLLGATLPGLLRVALGRPYLFPRTGAVQPSSYFRENFLFGLRNWIGQTVANLALTADIVLLGHFTGKESAALGYYGLAMTVTQFATRGLAAVTIVQQRLLQVTAGKAGGLATPAVEQATERFIAIDTLVSAWLSCAVAVAAVVAMPWLFPRYLDTVPLLGALLAGAIVSCPLRYTRVVLSLGDRSQLWVVGSAVQLGTLIAGMALVHYAMGNALWAYALARSLATAAGAAVEIVLAYAVLGQARRGFALFGRLCLALAPLALLGFSALPGRHTLGFALSAASVPPLVALSFALVFPGVTRDAARLLLRSVNGLLRRRGQAADRAADERAQP